ncbi:hypothetical protein BRADI_2g41680v3 [Brachypodium distachyon]|uniref:Sulfotransferase n=1 Tax=Brachypodium distachyon TaxID=15368 RepID=A0A0Q3GD13_BRADI|nr:hypothetical protein BRADI_2g41680v3 [Brachypodium distachyon]
MASSTTMPMLSGSGPVPFTDVDDDTVPKRPAKEEFGGLVAALPRKQQGAMELRLYQGFWLSEHWVAGTVVFQRRFSRAGTTYPKCGTTWFKALAFAAMTRAYPHPQHEHPLLRLNPHDCVPFLDDIFADGQEAKLEALPSPRLMNTHMPYTLLPESVTGMGGIAGCKVVYICRDPKDKVVSMWHFLRRRWQPDLSFAELFEHVCDGSVVVGPIWDHVLSYWHASVARPDRVLFLKYEDLLNDACGNVRRLAGFMGRPFSAAEEHAGAVEGVVELCSFERMKRLEANRKGSLYHAVPRDAFFRKGVAGDWVNYMTPEMAARLDEIVREKFRGTGLVAA